ncbi:UDP-glucose 4-epimerase [Cytobacillus horneckiae]|uniref:NAD-dependent epimerase/dehydratase family protein n=1 Tax=Cytobacillus horneckiae TaxID=549687 RepID=UPI0019CF8158|nr:NAD-dependent epimerase/dehydratase family protein [Cytobacillus horneckiae]
MKEKVLITGGCGFIGAHITNKLTANDYQVTIIDNLTSGKLSNIHHDLVTFYDISILDNKLREIILLEQPDYIIHLAAQVSVSHSINDVFLDENINIKGSLNVLEAAVQSKVKKIIYASSAAVYGKPKYLPIDTLHSINPVSPYGVSKYSVEKYIEMYGKLYGLDYTILRFANVFGPLQDADGEGGVISIFIDQLMQGNTPIIFGTGEQTRDFIYVEDVAEANIKALYTGSSEVLNISTGAEVSLNNLYKMMSNVTRSELRPIYEDARAGDIERSSLCNERTKRVLSWQPIYGLEDGLRETYRFYSSNCKL